MRFAAVIVAAGRGTRFGRPKQLVEIAGAPMLSWSIRAMREIPEIVQIVVATESEWLDDVAAAAADCTVVAGGATRQASTYAGLRAISVDCEGVLVHDGARPLITARDVRRGMEPVRDGHGALLAIPVVDTIKEVDAASGAVTKTLERAKLWAAQTPQFATLRDMLGAHEAGLRESVDATDDAMLLERAGIVVHVVPGSPENFKVTLPEDRDRAEHALRSRLAERR